MMNCNDCERYKREGHNYCRMCGKELNPGFVKYARLTVGYYVNEKFCGYCGKDRRTACKC